MAKQNPFLPDTSEHAQTETDRLYKELEPDANEIMFGEKTLPNRPLTMKEASKRKKVIMKLVDQRLKFKLIELMRSQVASKHNEHTAEGVSLPILPSTSHQMINHSQPSHSSTIHTSTHSHQTNVMPLGYPAHPQSNWFPQSVDGNWQQQHWQNEWQPPIYPSQHGTAVNAAAWNSNYSFQPNIPPFNVPGNMQNFGQNAKPNKPPKWKMGQNPNLICPAVNATVTSSAVDKDTKNSTKTLANVQPEPKKAVSGASSLISINCNQFNVNPAGKRLSVTPPLSKTDANPPPSFNSTNSPLKPRRRRRYGRKSKELKKTVNAAAKESGAIVLRDKFGLRCVNQISSSVATDGDGLWNEMKRLVTSIFRNEASQMEPLSPYEWRLHHKILIEMSTNPHVLRSEKVVSQYLGRITIEATISQAKMILHRVEQSSAQVQSDFAALREKSIGELKAMNDADAAATAGDANETADGNVIVRPGKRFFISMNRIIDAPFVVAVQDRSGTMSEGNAVILRDALSAKMDSALSLIRPKIIDPKFSDGSLVLVCANRKTFGLVKTIISGDFPGKWMGADLTVSPVPIKNPLSRSELKTVLLKFSEPQSDHFNKLMEQLKVDNPRLLVRRWELHKPPADIVIDSTERIYVGVDIESLGPIEEMNRVAILGNSTVTFDICYDDSERNYLPDHTLLAQ